MIHGMRHLLVTLPFLLAVGGCGHGRDPDSAVRLGGRSELGYHVRAGAASEIPGDAIGFVVTANGQGGSRIAWVAVDGSASAFSGSVSSDGVIDPASVATFSGREDVTLSADHRTLDFSSVPSGVADGVDFVPSADPIYVDLRVDGAPADIYFTGADTSRLYLSTYNPAAFTSP
jgi:hypothetical protein